MTDLQLARDKQRLFEDWRREHTEECKPLAMDLQVTVLTTGFWPTYKVLPANPHNIPIQCLIHVQVDHVPDFVLV